MNLREVSPAASAWLGWPEVERLVQAFTAADAPIRFVGGAVRDTLMGRPVHDIDAATPASPEQVMALLERAGIQCVPTGIAHGTVTAVLPSPNGGRRSIEITTLRRDVATDGRHATVAFTADWKADAQRRDFTLNALYADPDGRLHDPVGGLDHAMEGVVCFIGDPARRIQEDSLRILRFFRFQAQLGRTTPDAEALDACARYATMITALSGERIRAEMLKLLASPHPCPSMRLMQKTHVWDQVWPTGRFRNELMVWPQLREDAGLPPDPIRAMGILLPPGMEEQLAWIAARWKLSNAERARLEAMQGCVLPPQFDEVLGRLLYRHGQEPVLLAILRAWAVQLHADPASRAALRARYRPLLAPIEQWRKPEFPLAAADLMARGIPQGPALGETLRRLEHHWVEHDFRPSADTLLAEL